MSDIIFYIYIVILAVIVVCGIKSGYTKHMINKQFSKFPVISKQGNEYRVSVREEYQGCEALVCRVYIQVKSKIIRNKERFKKVYKYSDWDAYDKYRFDYKGFAIDTVERYESSIKKAKEKQAYEECAWERNVYEFENWDGKCE